MLTYATLGLFSAALGGAKRWDRTIEAIDNCDHVIVDVQYSVGDSLTYRLTSSIDDAELTGRRRYHAVRYVRSGSLTIEVAPTSGLKAVDIYSDLTDRQHFSGTGTQTILPAGTIAVIDRFEAIRDVEVAGDFVTLHVTVEGASFHNK